MAILTLAQFKALTGVSGNADDALYNALIPACQDAVEMYCDRKFDVADYQSWFTPAPRVRLHEYPVVQVRGVGTLADCAVLTAPTGDWTMSASTTGLDITSYASMTTTSFTWAANTTLAALKVAVEAGVAGSTLTITSGYSGYSTTRIRQGMGLTLRMAVPYQSDLEAQVDTETMTYVSVDPVPYPSGSFQFSETMWVATRAGYANADMPKGLQLALAGIVRETAVVLKTAGAGAIKSESVTNYDYTLFDNEQVCQIVESYSGALEAYRRKPVYDAE